MILSVLLLGVLTGIGLVATVVIIVSTCQVVTLPRHSFRRLRALENNNFAFLALLLAVLAGGRLAP